MNIGHSIPLQQINDWKESYFAEKATHFKLTQFNVKLFWEKLPLQEKEECLIISNSTLNHYLSHYISMLEYNYFRIHNEKNNKYFYNNESIPIFQIFDLGKYKFLLQSKKLSEKIELILILKKVNQPQFIEEKEKTEIQSLILLNLPLLRNFQNPIIKIKDAFFIDIFKKFEKFIPEFCSGDKIILPKENYNEFISDIFHNFFDSSNNIFNFEYDLDFIISLVYILLENNILDLYYRLFLVDCKEKFENKGDRDIQTNFSSSISLFERTNFCKVWFNVGKYSKIELKSFEKKEEKIEEINIIKDKEDFIIESLFESMEKKKNDNYNKNENDKKQLETSQTPHFEFITPNNCKLMNDLTGNNLNHFYYPFIQNPNSSKEENYKQKLAPIEIKKKKGKLPESSQKNTNNSHRIKGKKPF